MSEKLLLHACCAPCSVAVIDELRSVYDLTVLYYNPNIYPKSEYRKRKGEVERMCRHWGITTVDLDYDYEAWEETIGVIPQERESGPRCSACYRDRLWRTALYARAHYFDRFGSSLTSGRVKKSKVINAIGQAVATEVGLPFLAEDWKKGGRYECGLALVKQYQIYRQDYCGCRPSLEDRQSCL